MYYYNRRYINIFVLQCIFLILSAGAWSYFPSLLFSVAGDHREQMGLLKRANRTGGDITSLYIFILLQ